MWDNGICDDACNTYACGHNDCREDQIISYCTGRQSLEPISTYPSTSSSVRSTQKIYMGLSIEIDEPVHLTFDFDEDTVTLRMAMTYRLQWQDVRLQTSFCRCAPCTSRIAFVFVEPERSRFHPVLSEVLEDVLSLTGSSDNSAARGYFWAPYLQIEDSTEIVSGSTFEYSENTTWLFVPPSISGASCITCADYEHSSTFEVILSGWGMYHDYPFDKHTIRATMSVANADIFNCSEAFSAASVASSPST
jgi:hypothetical protein